MAEPSKNVSSESQALQPGAGIGDESGVNKTLLDRTVVEPSVKIVSNETAGEKQKKWYEDLDARTLEWPDGE
jgi:hypothetical protein